MGRGREKMRKSVAIHVHARVGPPVAARVAVAGDGGVPEGGEGDAGCCGGDEGEDVGGDYEEEDGVGGVPGVLVVEDAGVEEEDGCLG